MLQNKHVMMSLIIAPILALVSYFAVDYFVAERPSKAQAGQSYPLVAAPNCRYESGKCGLKNGEFEVTITVDKNPAGELVLTLQSAFPINAAGFAVVNTDHGPETIEQQPTAMTQITQDATQWQASFPELSLDQQKPGQLRLALSAEKSFYYAESSLAFVNYETSFGKDFR